MALVIGQSVRNEFNAKLEIYPTGFGLASYCHSVCVGKLFHRKKVPHRLGVGAVRELIFLKELGTSTPTTYGQLWLGVSPLIWRRDLPAPHYRHFLRRTL